MSGELVVNLMGTGRDRLPLPFELRDARGALVVRTTSPVARSVPAGLYHLRALTTSGVWREAISTVVDDATTSLVIDDDGPHVRVDPGATAPPSRPVPEILLADGPEPGRDGVPPDLVASPGASSAQVGVTWVFAASVVPSSVPTAVFRDGERTWTCSLPVNPRAGYPNSTCVATAAPGAPRLRVAAQRRQASTIEALVRAGVAFEAIHALGDALERVGSRRRDPVASVLAGYGLYGTRPLAEEHRWLVELARRDPWIPDLTVLVVAVELDLGAITAQVAAARLLAVIDERMLLTDALALAIRTLRRVSGDGADRRLDDALARLERQAIEVDWDAVFLTTR